MPHLEHLSQVLPNANQTTQDTVLKRSTKARQLPPRVVECNPHSLHNHSPILNRYGHPPTRYLPTLQTIGNRLHMLTKYKTTMFFDELVPLAPIQATLDCDATAIYTVQVSSSIAQAQVQSEQICMSHRMLLKQVLR